MPKLARNAANAETARRIEVLGIIMPHPCTRCVNSKSGRPCRVLILDQVSPRCSECVRKGRSCDVKPKMAELAEWNSLDRQKQKLREEADEATAKVIRTHQEADEAIAKVNEAMAKVIRIHKQQKLLEGKEKEMIRRGLQSLDDLEAEEAEEAPECETASSTIVASSSVSLIPDWPEAFDPSVLPDDLWAELGSSGDIVLEAPGNP